jgi:hypothetical protein
MSYPDLLEETGAFFVTETQKDIARVHRIEPALLEGLWSQFDRAAVTRDGLLLEWNGEPDQEAPDGLALPPLPSFCSRDSTRMDFGRTDLRQGFSLELGVCSAGCGPGRVLLDNRDAEGRGFCLQTVAGDTLELTLNDGQTENRWRADRDVLSPGQVHHVVAIVDGGPKIIAFVIDGRLCDGGTERPYGWGRFSPLLYHVNGAPQLRIAPGQPGAVRVLRVYGRALRISEAVASFKAQFPESSATPIKR